MFHRKYSSKQPATCGTGDEFPAKNFFSTSRRELRKDLDDVMADLPSARMKWQLNKDGSYHVYNTCQHDPASDAVDTAETAPLEDGEGKAPPAALASSPTIHLPDIHVWEDQHQHRPPTGTQREPESH